MKEVTKNHILKSRQGQRDYIMYGKKGPMIVEKIEAQKDSIEIWRGIHERLKGVIQFAINGDREGSYRAYKTLVYDLEAQVAR